MPEKQRTYIAIDLKSFYASVEARERGLDPMSTNLVVADASRTEKTICLAVSPSLKTYGIPGRPRLFEVVQKVKAANAERQRKAPGRQFTGESYDFTALQKDPSLAVSYIVAPPRMAYYMEYSTQIYGVYLKHVAPEDIHVYSIDEIFLDATSYLKTYKISAHDFAMRIIRDVLKTTGITATAGIGTNLYLAKIAMDIVAKKMPPDKDGVRIAELDELSYRQKLWTHRPLTDFWRVGKGYARKLEGVGLMTMGDVARCSMGGPADYYNEKLLYDMFGVNAELLIDHAWGWEPVTIADIKAYKPATNSISSGQVLQEAYDSQKARIVVHEMAESMAQDLLKKGLVTDQIVLTVGYDIENLTDPSISRSYKGKIKEDAYGRKVPEHAHGTENLGRQTSSVKLITSAALRLYDRIINERLLVRRLTLVAGRVVDESSVPTEQPPEQLDLFTDYTALEQQRKEEEAALAKERQLQQTVLNIKEKFGKNAILKGMNLQEGATAKQRNEQIGGHKA
ncbi:MAG: DNA methylase [Oscillospiraceae bacterium]|nr:DNA methylase [Oscillospiraceae bacterium]